MSEKRPGTETPSQQPQAQAAVDLSAAIEHLERGEQRRARAVLTRLRDSDPGSGIVERLLRQIDAPVEELLPGPYRALEVAPGDSLSLIAGRELGDPLLFYALARLNNIEAPARIPAGTQIRIPVRDRTDPAKPGRVSDPSGTSAADIESVAGHLARNGQPAQARRILIDWLTDNDEPAESAQRQLVGITLQEVSSTGSEGRMEDALAMVDEALAVVQAPTSRARLVQTRSALRSRELYRLALRLEEQGELQAAYARAAEAAALDASAPEPKKLAGRLESEVVDLLHEQALVAWRKRDVDLAIRNWESLLEIAPDFEPARIYIERARRLRRRLEQR